MGPSCARVGSPSDSLSLLLSPCSGRNPAGDGRQVDHGHADDVNVARKVLVVDDDELVIEVVGAVLMERGLEVVTHDAGFGLAKAVWTHRPDLIVGAGGRRGRPSV